VQWLEQASVDLIEISGGTYEQPKLLGLQGMEDEEKQNVAQSTQQRGGLLCGLCPGDAAKVNISPDGDRRLPAACGIGTSARNRQCGC
jgi:hypothetical protein